MSPHTEVIPMRQHELHRYHGCNARSSIGRAARGRPRLTANASSARPMGVRMPDPLGEAGNIQAGSVMQIVQKITWHDEFQYSGTKVDREGVPL